MCAVQATLEAAVAGRLKMLFVTPECLSTSWVSAQVSKLDVSLVCVDEAHYASESGASCRAGCAQLPELLQAVAPTARKCAQLLPGRYMTIKRCLWMATKESHMLVRRSFAANALVLSLLHDARESKRATVATSVQAHSHCNSHARHNCGASAFHASGFTAQLAGRACEALTASSRAQMHRCSRRHQVSNRSSNAGGQRRALCKVQVHPGVLRISLPS